MSVGLQCEWARSKAHADRWGEEVQLVVEEMHRVLAFLEWKASWWDRQRDAQLNVSTDILEGAQAYSSKQAHVNRTLAASFRSRWSTKLRQDEDEHMEHEQEMGEASMDSRFEFEGLLEGSS